MRPPLWFYILLILAIFGLEYGCSMRKIEAYKEASRKTADLAGYEWVGCETTGSGCGTWYTTCLVKVDGKIVDIDHVRGY